MSFDTVDCNQCGFGYSTMPKFYFKSEAGEIRALMYPSGSRSFESRFGYPASKEVSNKGEGAVEDLLCQDCHKVSEVADVDEKQCSHCGSLKVIGFYGLEGKPCPICELGTMARQKSLFDI